MNMKKYLLLSFIYLSFLSPSYAQKSKIIGFVTGQVKGYLLEKAWSLLVNQSDTDSNLKNEFQILENLLKDIESINDPQLKKQTYFQARTKIISLLSNQKTIESYEIRSILELVMARLDFDFEEYDSAIAHAKNVIRIEYPSNFFSGLKIDPELTKRKIDAAYLMCQLAEKRNDQENLVWCEITVAYGYSEESKISAIETCIKNNNTEDCGHVGTHLMNRFIDQNLGNTLEERRVTPKNNIDHIHNLIKVSMDFLPQDCLKYRLKNQHEITQCYWKAVGLEALNDFQGASNIYLNLCQHNPKSNHTQDYEYKSCVNINRPLLFNHLSQKAVDVRSYGCFLSHPQICEQMIYEYTVFNQSHQFKDLVNHMTSLCFQGHQNICLAIQKTKSSNQILEVQSLEVLPTQANEESWDILNGNPDVEILIYHQDLLLYYFKTSDLLYHTINQFSIPFDINPSFPHLDIYIRDLDVNDHDTIAQMKINLNDLQNGQMQDFQSQFVKSLKLRMTKRSN
jgi:hypothetical protein